MATRQQKTSSPSFNLNSHEWYLNRELTWLGFNQRVLHEATDDQVPLLERVFFVAVVGSNLDEFFMKRIGGLKQQVGAGVKKLTIDGMLPQEQIDACYKVAQGILVEQRRIEGILRELLAKENIRFCRYDELTATQKKEMGNYFKREIYPLLTPQGIDPAHPFPFISNLSLNLLVTLQHPGESDEHLARVKVLSSPAVLSLRPNSFAALSWVSAVRRSACESPSWAATKGCTPQSRAMRRQT